MQPIRTHDIVAVTLGVATYVAVAGWLVVLQIALGIATFTVTGSPLSTPAGADPLSRQIVVAFVFLAAGYVTGRASDQSALRNATILGALLYLLVTLFKRALWAAFELNVPIDLVQELSSLVRAALATLVGATAAEWHVRTRGAPRLDFLALSRRKQTIWFFVAAAPFIFFALAYRP
jgi:hypothetical protein